MSWTQVGDAPGHKGPDASAAGVAAGEALQEAAQAAAEGAAATRDMEAGELVIMIVLVPGHWLCSVVSAAFWPSSMLGTACAAIATLLVSLPLTAAVLTWIARLPFDTRLCADVPLVSPSE